MKKILIGVAAGLFVSVSLFAWGWKGMEKTYLVPKRTANQQLCDQLEICKKCDRNYDCLKGECSQNPVIKNRCQNIEENWKAMSLELTPENFVSSLCDKNDDSYNRNCLMEQSRNLKLKLNLALIQIPYRIGVNSFFTDLGIGSMVVPGMIILFAPPFLGFLIGWLISFSQRKEEGE